jgi:hypothetical protein
LSLTTSLKEGTTMYRTKSHEKVIIYNINNNQLFNGLTALLNLKNILIDKILVVDLLGGGDLLIAEIEP